jgi:hypothetical protein
MRESYDPSATADTIYFNDPDRQNFVKIDSELFEKIKSGKMRL